MCKRLAIVLGVAALLAAVFMFPHTSVRAQGWGANDRFLCGVNERNEIWCTSYQGMEHGRWERIPGSLKQVVVRQGHLWGVNSNDDIYYADDFRSDPGRWIHQEGKGKEIAEGHGVICIVNEQDQIWCADQGINTAHPQWHRAPDGANLKFISVN
jgi:Tectonin domain